VPDGGPDPPTEVKTSPGSGVLDLEISGWLTFIPLLTFYSFKSTRSAFFNKLLFTTNGSNNRYNNNIHN